MITSLFFLAILLVGVPIGICLCLAEASRENLGIRCAISQFAQRYNPWNEITPDALPAWS